MIGENELRWNVWECLVPSGKIEKSESDKVQSMYQAPNLTYIFIFPQPANFKAWISKLRITNQKEGKATR